MTGTPPGPAAGPTWPAVLGSLMAGSDLSADEAAWAMEQVLAGSASPAQIAAFATGLRAKGESAAEVDALVGVMLQHARLLDFGSQESPVALDVVGTGGDQAHTVNISTMSALVCAAAGAPVVKHGNRAASSSTGTADVLEELGVVIDLEPDDVVASVRDAGFGFCFAPVHHPAMRHAGPTRRELGVPTVFNILGPLTNPGGARAALIGCAIPALAPVMADVLLRRGIRSLVVRGEDGLDEVSIAGPTRVWDATGAEVVEQVVDVADLGIPRSDPALLRGGEAARNAELLRAALGGAMVHGPDAARVTAIRDAVAVNAAAALVAYAAALEPPAAAGGERRGGGADAGSESALMTRLRDQLPVAQRIIADGSALAVLDRWVAVTQSLRG